MKTQIFKLTLTDKYCTSGSTVVVQLSVLCPKPSPIFFWESELTNSIHCWGKKKKNWTKVSKSLRFLHGMYSLSLDTLLFLLCCCGSWTIYFLLRLSALNVYQSNCMASQDEQTCCHILEEKNMKKILKTHQGL